jgi:CrcB protein
MPSESARQYPRAPHVERGDVVDSDVDLRDPLQRTEIHPREWDFLLAIAAGGVLGAEGRYGIDDLLPRAGGGFPWATLVVNVSGSLLIGVLMVVLHALHPHRLVRPFFGVGLLGGYTTFATFGVDAVGLVRAREPWLALGYAVATLVLCLFAVTAATVAAQALTRRAARGPSPMP